MLNYASPNSDLFLSVFNHSLNLFCSFLNTQWLSEVFFCFSRRDCSSLLFISKFLFLITHFDLNPAFCKQNGKTCPLVIFSNSPVNNLGNSTLRGWNFVMKNNFINNNGATLLHTKNKKTKVEIQSIIVDQSQIELLKQKEQKIITELNWWETNK